LPKQSKIGDDICAEGPWKLKLKKAMAAQVKQTREAFMQWASRKLLTLKLLTQLLWHWLRKVSVGRGNPHQVEQLAKNLK
jgi:hypothetical protein